MFHECEVIEMIGKSIIRIWRSGPWSRTLILTSIPTVEGLLATLLFFAHVVFGARHGRGDGVIFLLSLPAGAGIESFPKWEIFETSDLVAIIWFPVLLNTILFFVVSAIVFHGLNVVRGSAKNSSS